MNEWTQSLRLTPSNLLNFLIALGAILLLAKLTDLIINRVLRRLTRQTRWEIDDKILDIAHQPVMFGVVLIGVAQALVLLELSDPLRFKLNAFLYSLLFLVLSIAAVRFLMLFIDGTFARIADKTGLSTELNPLLKNVAKVGVIVALLMAILSVWRVDITPLLASAGIAGVAVALAAKDTLANFFGGISVFVDRPYKIGDYIVLDDGQRGEVVNIGVRSTRIKTRDDILITIPNSVMANTKIINQSAPIPNFRIRIAIGVAYGSNVDQVESVLQRIAHENSMVLKEPAPRVRFRSFGDSALNFELLCWCEEPALQGQLVHQLNMTLYKTFEREGIKIPFPQRDIHFHHTGNAAIP